MNPILRLTLLPTLLFLLFLTACGTKKPTVEQYAAKAEQRDYEAPSKELRAIWWPTVFRDNYVGKSKDEIQADMRRQLDIYAETGVNVIIFQIRPAADAWYYSPYEPWSRFFTGEEGVPPEPLWDPLQFMIEESHKRFMELHAWINPYRAVLNPDTPSAPTHPIQRHPEWFLKYGKHLYFDPSLPEVRNYTCQVVEDIVRRYDIDAIHMDDYFYPYPIAGEAFPDQAQFQKHGAGFANIGDWRRDNVNKLIQELSTTIKRVKPYVRFGISPFGIYRNKRNDPNGSETNGLQNYDELYADVLHWDRMGWVDYITPQLYWEMGHKVADFTELAIWWSQNIKHADYYIGQHLRKTMDFDQLHAKWVITADRAKGHTLWPGEDLIIDYKGIRKELREKYWHTPALLPPTAYPEGYADFPEPPHEAHLVVLESGRAELDWTDHLPLPPGLESKYYIIYCHPRRTRLSNATDPRYRIGRTREHFYEVFPANYSKAHRLSYTITRIDRYNQERLVAHNIH